MKNKSFYDNALWKQKATAFVIRSHRHLWGKNNEDPQAFLFTRGLNNKFAKDMLIGWNKFGQERPAEKWGEIIASPKKIKPHKKLFLPAGIVIPFIVDKDLKSVFIHPYEDGAQPAPHIIPGSTTPTLLLEKKAADLKKNIVIKDLIDGLFLFQETRETCRVIIHPDHEIPLDNAYQSFGNTAESTFIFCTGTKEKAFYEKTFPHIPDRRFYTYQSTKELEKWVSNL